MAETASNLAELLPLTEEEAQELTKRILDADRALWKLLLIAYERRVWEPLGYSSWRDYAKKELGKSQSRIYQLLDQGRVIVALQEASSTDVEISEAEARDLKPILPEVVEKVRAEVLPLVDETQRTEVARAVVGAIREKIVKRASRAVPRPSTPRPWPEPEEEPGEEPVGTCEFCREDCYSDDYCRVQGWADQHDGYLHDRDLEWLPRYAHGRCLRGE